jgi:hypothetical protein
MTTNATIQLQPRQHDPAVWIERLLIFDTVEPLNSIREITFRRGVNVIWATEREEAGDTIGPTDVAGHSAGKTTLCRMLRYCLGEERFGTEESQRLIRLNIPGGYVGAHIWVEGTRWAVARPIGASNRHYASPTLSVEELLGNRTHANDLSHFLNAMEQALLQPLKIRQNPRTGLPIQWKQILAWCTRDQEAHYEDVWSWRSPRSASEPLGFEKPKVDAVFVMRVLLGLVAGDEPAALKGLKEKEAERDKAVNGLAEARKEPEYWNRHLANVLYGGLSIPADVPLEAEGLFQHESVAGRVAAFEASAKQEVKGCDGRIEELRREATQIRRERREVVRELNDCLNVLSQQEAGAKELEAGRSEAEQADGETLTELWTCPYSQKLVRDVECWGIYEDRKRKRSLMFAVAAQDLRDATELAKRQQAIADLREETRTLTSQAEQLRLKLESNSSKSEEIQKKRDDMLRRAESYATALTQLREWRAIVAGTRVHPRIEMLAGTLAERESDVRAAQDKVLGLLHSHKAGRERLASLFEMVVKAVISEKYGGKVTLSEGDLRFDITRGPPLGGEAVNILSVLLADVAALVASIEGSAFLPRFIIHDSPRESDLARHIYWNFLGLVFGLEAASGEGHPPAFQYIVTTTTPPPPTMRNKPPVQQMLNASEERGSLLCRVLTAAAEHPLIPDQQ